MSRVARDLSVAKDTVRIFWNISKENKRDLYTAMVLIPIYALCASVLVPLSISNIVAQISSGDSLSETSRNLIFLFIVMILAVIFNFLGYRALFNHQVDTFRKLNKLTMSALLNQSMRFFSNNFSGALTTHGAEFPRSFSQLQNTVFLDALGFITAFGAGLIVIFSQSLIAGAIMLISLVVVVGMVYNDARNRRDLRNERRTLQTRLSSYLADVITNSATVSMSGNEEYEKTQNKQIVDKWASTMRREIHMFNRMANKLHRTNYSLQLIFITAMIYLVNNEQLTISLAVFSVLYLTRLSTQLFSVGPMIFQAEQALTDAAPMTRILLETPEIVDVKNAKKIQVSKGQVEFNEVGFSYSDNEGREVIKDLNIKIDAGTKIGLVGPSGGGKTTITKLLLRFMDIQKGEINIDSQNIAEVTQKSLRNAISYVPQEPMLFHRTLSENIRYGKLNATDDEVIEAAKKAHAHEFIKDLPNGYDTLVGERGVKLSGGQRQRVAIARAILKDAPILVLDEATSALDSESEKLIQDALGKLMKNRTSIVIAHRLSTIQKMDRIIVLDKGQITEEGSHTELLALKGTYAKLWAHQSGGFLED